jgi:hypothetical protein
VRDRARADLEEVGEAAQTALEKALAAPASAETARQAKALLDRLKAQRRTPSGSQLQALRALEVLEHIGTPAAKEVLERLGQGGAGSPPDVGSQGVAAPAGQSSCREGMKTDHPGACRVRVSPERQALLGVPQKPSGP